MTSSGMRTNSLLMVPKLNWTSQNATSKQGFFKVTICDLEREPHFA